MKRFVTGLFQFWIFACLFSPSAFPLENGLSHVLALERATQLREISYNLSFKIPADVREKIIATAEVRFLLKSTRSPVILDFKGQAEDVQSMEVNQEGAEVKFDHQHLILNEHLKVGENKVIIRYQTLPAALHRSSEFVYTLLVPDRASQLFPCFDQPDLKANFTLHLDLPKEWVGVGNESVMKTEVTGDRLSLSFSTTPLQSTYLFAFAVGKFKSIQKTLSGRTMTLYYRESDEKKVGLNVDQLFSLHQTAVKNLEDYTGVSYPNSKLDFVLLPSFPFSGMEHPGAIFYKEESLFLDATATTSQIMSRANTISHEVSHQWFGNLVTMKWFDDVWLKEVMANFFAAKVTDPLFPQFNHQLKFYAQHFPGAYAIDRSEGANAIHQDLDNLQNAGSLYGGIIYLKAPILMRQLEELLGPKIFQAGIREYLHKFNRGNASWSDLIVILKRHTRIPLQDWNRVWINGGGRPEIAVESKSGKTLITQSDPSHQKRIWIQKIKMDSIGGNQKNFTVTLDSPQKQLAFLKDQKNFILNSDGMAYGLFRLNPSTQSYLFQNINSLPDPLVRMVAWGEIWDDFYETLQHQDEIEKMAFSALTLEKNEIVKTDVLTHFSELYWRFMTDEERKSCQKKWEDTLWSMVMAEGTPELKALYFNHLMSLSETPEAIEHLEKVLRREITIPGLPLNEADEVKLAHALAIRAPERAEVFLKFEEVRLQDADRKAEYAFTRPAFSADEKIRKNFFDSLKNPENRRKEVWVLTALQGMSHRLRPHPDFMVKPALDELADIQRTSDLFFPGNWLMAILGGQSSPEAAKTIRNFLTENPNYPADLKQKILQASDILFRSLKRPKVK